ncbi:hypothetical protein ACNFH8_28115 [Pseudomonas sp. NY15436]|uniref:hypothetical protein n=1 Tax=Pseudomonas sp. NY15436 TaxID=3400359 RepID=UPI003A8B9C99
MTDALDLDTQFHFHDGKMTVQRTQDCTPIAEFTKTKHNAGMYGSSEMKHAASIPYVMIEKYCNDHGITFREWCVNKEHIKRMLNDPDLKAFRVWPGAV